MQRQLDALNVDYHFIEAIDKRDLHLKEYRMKIARELGVDESWMESNYERSMNTIYQGFFITLSHVKVWNIMIKNKIPVACILEDDMRLSSDFLKILRDSREIPWDILKLNSYTLCLGLKNYLPFLLSFPPLSSTPLYRLIRYSKRTLYIAYLVALNFTKCLLETVIGYLYFFSSLVIGRGRPSKKYVTSCRFAIHAEKLRYYRSVYYMSKIGGSVDRNKELWHKIASKYRIVEPMHPAYSMGGYMITLPAATAIKQIHTSGEYTPEIDTYDCWRRYQNNGLKLYIIIPSCIELAYQYLVGTTGRDD